MITIVEGPDCTGKSTLIKNAFNPIFNRHFGPPSPKGAWEDYTTALAETKQIIDGWYDDEVREERRNYVFDRFVYGELVYPEVVRRSSTLDQITLRMLERVLLSMETTLIICLTNEETALELWRERQGTEFLRKEEQYKQAYELWRQLINKGVPALPMITYDLEKDSYKEIQTAAKMRCSPENRGPGIGMYRSSSIVLVGEQVNKDIDIWGWPFVAREGSSYWLTQQLAELSVCEDQLYWLNALDRDGRETSPAFLDDMRPDKVITLGKSAELWAKRNKIQQFTKAVRSIAHPQYHKRFKSKEPYALGEAIFK